MTIFRKFYYLSKEEKMLLFYAGIVVGGLKIALQTLSFSHFKDYFEKIGRSQIKHTYDSPTLAKTAWAVQVVGARWPWRATCLPQALAYKYLLRKDPSLVLQIGVNKSSEGAFQAHAWVEKNGKILIGDVPEYFQPLWQWQ